MHSFEKTGLLRQSKQHMLATHVCMPQQRTNLRVRCSSMWHAVPEACHTPSLMDSLRQHSGTSSGLRLGTWGFGFDARTRTRQDFSTTGSIKKRQSRSWSKTSQHSFYAAVEALNCKEPRGGGVSDAVRLKLYMPAQHSFLGRGCL